MSTISSLLPTLNTLRTAAGLEPMKSWKASKAALEAKIAEMTPASEPLTIAEWARINGYNPKVVRARLRRHNLPRSVTPEVIALFA